MRYIHAFVVAVLVLLGGCRSSSVQDELASLSGAVVRGMRDTLTNNESRRQLAGLLDTLVMQGGSGIARTAGALRDTLAGARTRALISQLEASLLADLRRSTDSLRDDLIGPRTADLAAGLRDRLLGTEMRRLVAGLRGELLGPATLRFAAALRDTLLGDATRQRVGALRDDLLGDSTAAHIAALRESLVGAGTQNAIDSIVSRSLRRVQETTSAEREGLTSNVTTVLWTGGGIVAVLVLLAGIIFLRSRRYRRMLALVTRQIERMPDQGAYDELTGRIDTHSRKAGLEKHLQNVLRKEVKG